MARLCCILAWKFVAPGYKSERRFEVVIDPEVVEKRKLEIGAGPPEFHYDAAERPHLVRELVFGTWPGEEDQK